MLALWVVEQLNVLKDVSPRFLAGPVFPASDVFPLQKLKEALGDSVVMAIAPAAHGVFQIVFVQEGGPFTADELGPLPN